MSLDDDWAPTIEPVEAMGEFEAEVADLADMVSTSLWEGDEGGLEFAQRRCLVLLLKQRFISARTHPRDWQVLVDHRRVIQSRLNDLFLELAVDDDREVAWKRQASGEAGERFPTLLYDTAWSREETILLVHLRDRLRAGAAGGDSRVFVDREDLMAHVASFRPAHATDEAGDEKRARNAVTSLLKAGLLIAGATEDRFEINAAVEPLLPLELLVELLESLRKANGGGADQASSEDGGVGETVAEPGDLFEESQEDAE